MTISFKRKIIKGGCVQNLQIVLDERIMIIPYSKNFSIGFRIKVI